MKQNMPFLEAENHKNLNLCAVSNKKPGEETEMESEEREAKEEHNGKKE